MKSMLATFVLVFAIAGCSSSSNDDKGANNTPFGKLSGGQWLSACQQDDNGNFKEALSLNGTSGTSTNTYYQNQDCSGAVVGNTPARAFTYTTVQKAGGKDGEAKVTITFQNEQPVAVDAIIQDNTMVIIRPDNQTIIYQRVGGGPGGKPGQGNGGAMAAFDALARGNWMSQNCAQVPNSGATYLQILTIHGNGRANTVYNVYDAPNCQGNPTPQGQAALSYQVDRFANGGGQLTIDGNALVDVFIQGPQMTLRGAAGTQVFRKIQ